MGCTTSDGRNGDDMLQSKQLQFELMTSVPKLNSLSVMKNLQTSKVITLNSLESQGMRLEGTFG